MKTLRPIKTAEVIYNQIATEYNNEKAEKLTEKEVFETILWLRDTVSEARLMEADYIILFSFKIDIYSGKIQVFSDKERSKVTDKIERDVRKLRKENWFGEFEDPNSNE